MFQNSYYCLTTNRCLHMFNVIQGHSYILPTGQSNPKCSDCFICICLYWLYLTVYALSIVFDRKPEKTRDGKAKVSVTVAGKDTWTGVGRSYRMAKEAAAKQALIALNAIDNANC